MSHKTLIAHGIVGLALAVMTVAGTPAPAKAASWNSTGKGCTANIYKSGKSSTCVKYIQTMLNGINHAYASAPELNGAMLSQDGIFGAKTASQVKRFQNFANLTKDSIVGPKTWDMLCFLSGQVAFWYPSAHDRKQAAWQAAYNAGCRVEYQASNGALKWKSRY